MAVAATFLTVSATSAMAQADPARNSAAELAIDAAIPRPEPANVPPPTINDFKLDSVAPAADAAKADAPKAAEKPPEAKPSDVVTAPERSEQATPTRPTRPRPRDATGPDARTTTAAPPAATATPAAEPPRAGQGREQRAGRGSAGRRQAQGLAGRQIGALFRAQGRTDRGREILHRARICAAVDARRRADRDRQGRHRAAEGCRLRRPQSRRLSGAGFRRRLQSRCAGGSRSETDRQHDGLCAPGAERPDALFAGLRRYPVSGTPDRSQRSAGQCHHRQGRLGGARQLQPAAKALSRIEGEARRTARPGRRTGRPDRRTDRH